MYDIGHIVKKVYEFHKEKNRKAIVWINTTTQTIHIEGGEITMSEVYKQVQEMLGADPTLESPFEVKDNETN